MPKARMSVRGRKPSSFSTSNSTGRPWQSQPQRRGTWIAAHREVARHDVLDVRRQDVAVVRQAGRERRAVVEHVPGPAGRAARRDCSNVRSRCQRASTCAFERGEVDFVGNGAEWQGWTLWLDDEAAAPDGLAVPGRKGLDEGRHVGPGHDADGRDEVDHRHPDGLIGPRTRYPEPAE